MGSGQQCRSRHRCVGCGRRDVGCRALSFRSGVMAFAYVVSAEIADAATADAWVAWLRDDHLAKVLRGGAQRAEVLELSQPGAIPRRFEVRYRFASAEAFAAYERDFAPGLRAEGLARFPARQGVRLSRATASVVFEA